MTRARASAWLACAIGIGALLLGVRRYYPFLSDDALISLRYADRLLQGHGLTWSDGQRVEGYSDLLWVLACAALGALGFDLVDAARIAGIAGAIVAIAAMAHFFAPRARGGFIAAAYGSLALGLAGPLAVWAIGGLEQPMLAGLLALGITRTWGLLEQDTPRLRDALVTGALLGLLALVRPDGALFPVAIASAAMAVRVSERRGVRPFVWLVLPGVAFACGQLLFRVLYYQDIVPNTAHAKLGGWRELHEMGLAYAADGLVSVSPLVVVAACGALASVRDRELRRRVLVCAVPLVAWLAYVVRIGGDIFPGHRHHVPTLVLVAFMGAAYVGSLSARIGRLDRAPSLAGRRFAYCAAGLVVGASGLALTWLEALQRKDPHNIDAREERWEWTCKRIAEAMGRAYRRDAPLAAVDPAGCFPYWSGLASLDMIGLNDRFIATHPPKVRWRYPLAHDLGHPAYVLQARPDIIVLCNALGNATGCYPSGVGITGDRSFHQDYRLVTFELPPEASAAPPRKPLTWQYWLRYADGPLGRRSTPNHIALPAHFFTASPRRVTFDDDGRASIRGGPGAPFRIEAVTVPAGRWRLAYEASAPIAEARIHGTDAPPLVVGPSDTFEADGGNVDIELDPTGCETRLYTMTLERAAL
jgi:hypothetical protein